MKIALISIGSSGTGGHDTLIASLQRVLATKHDVIRISDHSGTNQDQYQGSAYTISSGPHQESVSGKIEHVSYEHVLTIIDENGIDHLVFSTFFDERILRAAAMRGIRTTLVSYPLRDSYRELFYLRGFDQLFTDIIILEDMGLEQPYRAHGAKIGSYQPTFTSPASREDLIVVSCGGAGLQRSERFTRLIERALASLAAELEPYTLMISHSSSRPPALEGANVTIKPWYDSFPNLLARSKLAIGEAGFFSTQELLQTGTQGILIPGRRRMDNQELRAVMFERHTRGACVLTQEGPKRLEEAILSALMVPPADPKAPIAPPVYDVLLEEDA